MLNSLYGKFGEKSMKRKTGFYWVRLYDRTVFEVAQWGALTENWRLSGDAKIYKNGDFEEIKEDRIEIENEA